MIGRDPDLPLLRPAVGDRRAAQRIIEIVSEEGTLNNAREPGRGEHGVDRWRRSRRRTSSRKPSRRCSWPRTRYRDEAQASWTPGINGPLLVAADRHGEPFVDVFTDCFGGGGGARTFTDGIDSGGIFHSMASRSRTPRPLESRVAGAAGLPARARATAAAHGRFRGGVGVEFGMLPHKNPIPIVSVTLASGVSQPRGPRALGGLARRRRRATSSSAPPTCRAVRARRHPATRRTARPARRPTSCGQGSTPLLARATSSSRSSPAAAGTAIRCGATPPSSSATSPRARLRGDRALSLRRRRRAMRPRPPRRATRSAPSVCATARPGRRGRRRRDGRGGRVCTAVSDTVEAVERRRAARAALHASATTASAPYGDDHKQGGARARAARHRRSAAQRARARRRMVAARVLLPRLRDVVAMDVQLRPRSPCRGVAVRGDVTATPTRRIWTTTMASHTSRVHLATPSRGPPQARERHQVAALRRMQVADLEFRRVLEEEASSSCRATRRNRCSS